MYECLVGHLPFEGKNPAQVLRRVLEGSYPAPDRERPTVGGRWTKILASALAKDPADRISTAAQLGERIQEELTALGITDARAEIAAYFADPAGYAAAHKGRLVPKLVARGEAARKTGDVWGAAADYNRALALAPNDLAILKRLAGLRSSADRHAMLRRAAVIVAGSAALGLGAFGIARAFKGRTGASVAPSATVAANEDAVAPRAETRPTPDASQKAPVAPTRTSAAAVVPSIPRTPAQPTAVVASATKRKVQFFINPGGATLEVDGSERRWLGQEIELSVGPHQIVVTPNDPKCCKKLVDSVSVELPPQANPDAVQPISRALELNPTFVSLATGAPPGATLSCRGVVEVSGAGVPTAAKLPSADYRTRCWLKADGRQAHQISVHFKAGENTTVEWVD
jgi:serine/threonine-protein kinase